MLLLSVVLLSHTVSCEDEVSQHLNNIIPFIHHYFSAEVCPRVVPTRRQNSHISLCHGSVQRQVGGDTWHVTRSLGHVLPRDTCYRRHVTTDWCAQVGVERGPRAAHQHRQDAALPPGPVAAGQVTCTTCVDTCSVVMLTRAPGTGAGGCWARTTARRRCG